MCELCNLEKKTKWHYEDEKWIICDCQTCNIPMAVYRQHMMEIPLSDMQEILVIIKEKIDNCYLRMNQRKIKDHFHFHIIGGNNK